MIKMIDEQRIEQILNSQYNDQKIKDSATIFVIRRDDLPSLKYVLNETRKIIDLLESHAFFQDQKYQYIIDQFRNAIFNPRMTSNDINKCEEEIKTFMIKTLYYEYKRCNYYSTILQKLENLNINQILNISEMQEFLNNTEVIKLVFSYDKKYYLEYLVSEFERQINLNFIIEGEYKDTLLDLNELINIYRIFIYNDKIDLQIFFEVDALDYSNNISYDLNYDVHQTDIYFKNLTLCDVYKIEISFEGVKLATHFVELLFEPQLTLERKLNYLIKNCPDIAQRYIDKFISFDVLIDSLMPILEHHFFLHTYLNSALEGGIIYNKIYYTLAQLILERPTLTEEERIIVLKYLDLAGDYADAKQLLNKLFFSFLGLKLNEIPNLNLELSIEGLYEIAKFFRDYKK